MGTLYIIGNGFDLYFGLRTKTEHFMEYLKKQPVYNEIDGVLDVLNWYGVDWSEYEQSLNYIDLDELEFQNEIQPDYLSDRESDRDNGICNMQMYVDSISEALYTALEQMTANADDEVRKLSAKMGKKTLFQSGDAILTFNYTATVEHLFNVPKNVPIFHIHGFYSANSKLIFGYKSNANGYTANWSEADDYYIARQRETVYEFYEKWRKHLKIEELRSFLQNCKSVDRVVVLGHSMSAVDAKYMELIEEYLHPISWEISYHEAKDEMKKGMQKYSFDNKIEFVTIEKLINRPSV